MNSIDYKELASKIMDGEYVRNIPSKTWASAISYTIENYKLFSPNADKMHMLWIESGGHIRKHVSNDLLVLTWLRIILPKYSGEELRFIAVSVNFFTIKA
nr:hypothetical protein [Enterovibrio nigricans]